MVVELLLEPPAVIPGFREAGLHLDEPAVDIGPDLGEAAVDLGEAAVGIGPDLGEAAVETKVEETKHGHQDAERGQLERHQAGDGSHEYGWLDSRHAAT